MYPSLAEQARTAVAQARVAALTTYSRHDRPLITSVTLHEDSGRVVLSVPTTSTACRGLQVRPLATVRVAPAGHEPTTLQGAVRRLPGRPGNLITRFSLDPGAVRVGGQPGRAVAALDYLAAVPDPLREEAPRVLAHLREEHAAGLLACLRAHGHHDSQWVEAVSLDRYGLDVIAVDDGGVSRMRLAFPAPVLTLHDLAPHLFLVLHGTCKDCSQR